MRPRLTYANVAATLALVFSMGGSALAAQHYVITKVTQISPGVRKQLRGAQGPQGPQGPQGSGGPAAIQDPAGAADGSASSEELCSAIGEAAVLANERNEAGLEEALGNIYLNGCNGTG